MQRHHRLDEFSTIEGVLDVISQQFTKMMAPWDLRKTIKKNMSPRNRMKSVRHFVKVDVLWLYYRRKLLFLFSSLVVPSFLQYAVIDETEQLKWA